MENLITFWECESCGFRMWDKHTFEDGTIECPLCEIEVLRAELAQFRNVTK